MTLPRSPATSKIFLAYSNNIKMEIRMCDIPFSTHQCKMILCRMWSVHIPAFEVALFLHHVKPSKGSGAQK